MKAFDWDLCDLHVNTDMVMGRGCRNHAGNRGAALHEKLLSSRPEHISKLYVFPAIIAQIRGPLRNLLNLNYLHSLS